MQDSPPPQSPPPPPPQPEEIEAQLPPEEEDVQPPSERGFLQRLLEEVGLLVPEESELEPLLEGDTVRLPVAEEVPPPAAPLLHETSVSEVSRPEASRSEVRRMPLADYVVHGFIVGIFFNIAGLLLLCSFPNLRNNSKVCRYYVAGLVAVVLLSVLITTVFFYSSPADPLSDLKYLK